MIKVKNLNQALIEGCKLLKREGVARKTRGFDCIEVPYPVLICIENPRDRFITVPERKWNKTLGWIESLWLWQGINSMDMVGSYVKNLYNFSDDGKFMRAGYGPRMRGYNGELEDYTYDKPQFNTKGEMEFKNCVDQVKFVIEKLKQDPNSRQASITIHDPVKDNFELDGSLKKTKDTPCTRTIQFMMVDGKLDCTVTMRSNDIWWGTSAVNVFNFSLLQEIIAMVLGVPVGKYYHFANNLHYYSDLEEMVNSVSTLNTDDYYKHYEYPDNGNITLEEVDYQIRYIAELEECSRMGKAINEDSLNKLKPLFRDWFYAIHKRNNKGIEVEFNNPQMSEIYK